MSMMLRLSCLTAALAWMPVSLAQINPPLMGVTPSAPIAAPTGGAPANAPAPAARPVVRQLPAAPPSAGAQAAPVAPGAPPVASTASVSEAPAGSASAAPAPAVAAPRLAAGATTRGLLALQASGRAAGAARPVLGPMATAAWDRYLDSFTHPIPEWFEQTVEVAE